MNNNSNNNDNNDNGSDHVDGKKNENSKIN